MGKSRSSKRAVKAFQEKNKMENPKKAKKKIKLLIHGDSTIVKTGFGNVMYNIFKRLAQTGDYEIVELGINNLGRNPERNLPGIKYYPLPDLDGDAYGEHSFPQILKQEKPDIIFTLQDIFVIAGGVGRRALPKNWYLKAIKQYATNTPWVYYFPIDSEPWRKEWADIAFSADRTVVYSKYAQKVLHDVDPTKEAIFLPHGVDTEKFHPVSDDERKRVRKAMSVEDDEFLVGFIARNQPRKNPAALVEIFKMANDGYYKCNECDGVRALHFLECDYCGAGVEDSTEHAGVLEGKGKLYFHCNMTDPMGIDLYKILQDNESGDDVIFRPEHSIPFGVPDEQFNAIMNALDVHFLPTQCEGFGLPILETMACGVPNIVTRTTATIELLEDGRGISVVPAMHHIFEDSAYTRKHLIHPERAIHALGKMYEDFKSREPGEVHGPLAKEMGAKGIAYAKSLEWDRIAKEFDKLFKGALAERVKLVDEFSRTKETNLVVLKDGHAGDILQTLPAIKEWSKKVEDSEIVYVIPQHLIPIFKGRYDFIRSFVPIEKLNDTKDPEDNIQIALLNMNGVEARYEGALYPFIEKSRPELYAMNCNITDPISLSGMYELTPLENEMGDKVFAAKVPDRDKFTVGFCDMPEIRRNSWGEFPNNWDSLEKYCTKMGMNVVRLDPEHTLGVNLRIMQQCDVVVASDNAVFDFLNALNIKTMAILSPYWQNSRTKGFTNCTVISKPELKGHFQEPVNNPNEPNPFLENISVSEVFSKLIIAQKGWKAERNGVVANA